MRSSWVTTGVAAGLVLTACSGGAGDVQPIPDDGQQSAPEPDVEESDEPDVEPDEPDDPFALPDEIDEDYLQRVTDEIMAIRKDILRRGIDLNQAGEEPRDAEALEMIGSVFASTELLASNANNFTDMVRATNLEEIYRQPDDLDPERFFVMDVFEAADGCAVFTAEYDSSGIRPEPTDREPFFVLVLEHRPEAEDINPTGWKVRDEQRILTGDGELASQEQVEGIAADTAFSLVDNDCQAEDAG